MNYLVYRNQKKGIPTVLAIVVVLLVTVAVGYVARNKPAIQVSLPDNSEATLDTSVTGNVRDNTVTFFWRTDEPTKGYIQYGDNINSVNKKAFDSRETENDLVERKEHFVTVDSLEPASAYYYYIIADGKKIGQSQNVPFQVETTDSINGLLSQEPVYGNARTIDRLALDEGVIIATVKGAEPLLALTKKDGSYSLSPCCVKKGSRSEVFAPGDSEDVKIEVYHNGDQESYLYAYDELKGSDELVLGEPIALEKSSSEFAEDETELKEAFLQRADEVVSLNTVDIVYPKDESIIPDTRPLYKGIGEPGANVKGRIEPDGKLFQVSIDDKGQWIYSSPVGLTPGRHTLSVQTTDRLGNLVALERDFTILKSGEAVLGESTPSATLTPEVSVSPTVEPTVEPETTEEPLPTEAPLPTAVSEPSSIPTKPPPVSGTNILPFASVSLVLIMIGMGAYLLY